MTKLNVACPAAPAAWYDRPVPSSGEVPAGTCEYVTLEWLRTVFGSDGSPIVQYVVIFAIIFAALAAIVLVVRPLSGRGLSLKGRAGTRGRQPRLGIVDVYELDRARQLILLRRDNVEHLLLVGGPNDVVVERNIQRGQRPPPEAALRPAEPMTAPFPAPLAEPLPDPLSGAGQLPEPPRPFPELAGRRPDPVFEMPVVVPSSMPGSGAAPPVTLPRDVALIGGDEPGQDLPTEPTAVEATDPAAMPRRAAPARESFFPRRILQRTAPPPLDPRPEPASERAQARTETDSDGPTGDVGARMPPLRARNERRTVDPAVLSDMARQLQAALARPASAVAPALAAEPPVAPPPVSASPATTPAITAQIAPGGSPPPPTASATPSAVEAKPPAEAADPPPAEIAPAPPEPPALSAPAVEQAPPSANKAAAPSPPAQPAPVPEPAGNPFSVEEIEAEFARLLGRPLDKRS